MHRHVWKIVSTDIRPTPFESALSHDTKVELTGSTWFERDVIVKARCEGCGTEKVYRA